MTESYFDYMEMEKLYGQYVRVHVNLYKKLFNISQYFDGTGWRLAGYADQFLLLDVGFHVSQSGNLRARETGHRNVHAYMYGTLNDPTIMLYNPLDAMRFTYNPYKGCTFMDADGRAVHEAAWAVGTVHDRKTQVYGLRKD